MNQSNRPLVPVPSTPTPVATAVIDDGFIKSRIHTIRGEQVMLDRDLAVIYGVETKALNQAVKRNAERFPDSFMFRLSSAESEKWKSQIVTSNLTPEEEAGLRMGLRRPPHAFTEQGIAMLSAVLKSKTAVLVSIRIMEIFVAMRRAFVSMAPMLARLDNVERRQITDQARNEERFDTIFKAMDGGDFPPQKVFYDGQVYDAFERSILILDRSVLIHVGASLNYLGKRRFAFSSLDKSNIPDILAKI